MLTGGGGAAVAKTISSVTGTSDELVFGMYKVRSRPTPGLMRTTESSWTVEQVRIMVVEATLHVSTLSDELGVWV